MVYAPELPFNSGTPETAPAAILEQARQSVAGITTRREQTARRIAARLGVDIPRSHIGEKRGPIGISAARRSARYIPVNRDRRD
jgi:hypothetical protein